MDGKVRYSFGLNTKSYGYGLAIQPDGKIVLARRVYNSANGTSDFALVRLQGSLGLYVQAFDTIDSCATNAALGQGLRIIKYEQTYWNSR
jgi:hypothetical protein